jgi:serine/threonine protein phosphatase PrpC
VPVRVSCPHCRTPCLVADRHLGVPVQCGRCSRSFTTRADPAPSPPPQEEDRVRGQATLPIRLDLGAATSPGRVRDRNEDSLLLQYLAYCNLDVWHELAVLVVADGMGGAAAGEKASGLVIRSIGTALTPLLTQILNDANMDSTNMATAVTAALREANRAVWDTSRQDASCKGMGATAVVAVVWDAQVFIGHIGDCRVYHERAGKLAQVTRDQTLVARMVELGHLTPKQALTHRARNEVTNAIGISAEIVAASYQLQLNSGDWLILACDGLHAHLDNAALQAEIAASKSSAAQLAQRLVECADERGGSDNCTVLVVRCY